MSGDCYEMRVRLHMPPAPRVSYTITCEGEVIALVLDDGRIAVRTTAHQHPRSADDTPAP